MPYPLRNQKILVPSTGRIQGTGWLPPMIDPRDYTAKSPQVQAIRAQLDAQLKKHQAKRRKAADSVDLREWCSPIENQEQLGSCSAHAALGIVEYFERRAFGRHLDGSRLFIYKTTRNLIGVTGDTGAWLRNAMGALVTCGVPLEQYWPYTDADPDFDVEPSPFVYAVADNFETTKYFAHDPLSGNVAPAAIVASVKDYLVTGVPSMFGFWGYPSFDSSDQPGHIPLPTDDELNSQPAWGHAISAMGFDDARKIKNTVSNKTTTGAFLIRNSWGTTWGDAGYGWMPYDYVLQGIAMDFWSLIDMEYVQADQFVS